MEKFHGLRDVFDHEHNVLKFGCHWFSSRVLILG
jgi:hypothetical protein